MKAAILAIFFINAAFSQGKYVSNENALSAGLLFGRYGTDNKYGFTGSYSVNGFLDFSFTRSSILTEESISNFQNEYFLRVYAPKKNRFFVSAGLGYLYQQFKTDLWKDFPLVFINKGVAFEGGLHLVTEEETTRRVIMSISYMYFAPTEELRTPAFVTVDSKLTRAVVFDATVVYYFGYVGAAIGPTVALDSDFNNVFFGLHSSIMLRH